VVSGTGSVAVGCWQGSTALAGGWGHLLGDESRAAEIATRLGAPDGVPLVLAGGLPGHRRLLAATVSRTAKTSSAGERMAFR
jgi:hypothetical protein